MKKLLLFSMLILIVFSGDAICDEEITTLRVKPGVYHVKFISLKAEKTPADLFGDEFFRHDEWAESIRLITAEAKEVKGCYLTTKPTWEGTLEKVTGDEGYWMVIPWGAGEFEMEIQCKKVLAGYAYQLSGGITVGYSNGKTITTSTSTPQSSATYKKVDKKVKNITAFSSVHVQQQSESFSQKTASSLSPSTLWVNVPLDTVYGLSNGSTWFPVTQGGTVSVPQPMDFSKQPW